MAKSSFSEYTPLILGGAALFILYKSDFFKGLSKVSDSAGDIVGGVASGVQGLGGGVATAAGGLGEGIKEVASDIGQTTSNFADFFNPLGEMGRIAQKQMELEEMIKEEKQLRSAKQEATINEDAFKIAAPALTTTAASSLTHTASEQAKRQTLIQDEFSQWTYRATTADEKIINWVKSVSGEVANVIAPIPTAITKTLKSNNPTNINTSLSSGGVVTIRAAGSSKSLKSSDVLTQAKTMFNQAIGATPKDLLNQGLLNARSIFK